MPMLSPQLATRAGPNQGPWEIFGRRETESNTPPGSGSGSGSLGASVNGSANGSEEDVLHPLQKTRAGSLGGLTTSSFRPFDSGSRGVGSAASHASLLIHNLPRDMTQRELHLMFTFANDYVSSELVREHGRVYASVKFRSMGGATAAQAVLEHRPDIFLEATSWLKCEIRPGSSTSGVSTPTTGQPPNIKSRFLFMNEDPTTPTNIDPPTPSSSASSSSAFLPSSPLYTPSSSRLFDPLPLPRRPSNGTFEPDNHNSRPGLPPRRASVPTRPIQELAIQPRDSATHRDATSAHREHIQASRQPQQSQMAQAVPASSAQGPSSASQPSSTAAASGSEYDPTKVVVPFGPGTSKAKAVSIMQNGGRVMPPANPADQNPPCNTLYVGNLPPDTQEDELKDLFSARPGYKRLCFRTKANGPMCFVEFEDEVFAGKALEDLYGFGLSNSVKGGIRLSFSKNPLGVRSRQPQQKYFN